jgi:hypothetical protein
MASRDIGPIINVRRGSKDFEVTRKKVDDLTKMFKERMPRLAVGLPKGSMPYPDGTSVIMVGFWNEFGSADGEVPARSWLRTGAHQNRDKWLQTARRIMKALVKSGKDPVNAFALLGHQMEGDIKNSISEGEWADNQGSYAAWKLTRGYTKPLIVTGHMRASVRYVISEAQNDNPQ